MCLPEPAQASTAVRVISARSARSGRRAILRPAPGPRFTLGGRNSLHSRRVKTRTRFPAASATQDAWKRAFAPAGQLEGLSAELRDEARELR
eukprot:2895127-Prymnesium_polylepis.1